MKWQSLMWIQNIQKRIYVTNEYLGKQIATIHNLGFYMWLVREARKHILQAISELGKK
jgi:queuine tRNA-ribosyltransferase